MARRDEKKAMLPGVMHEALDEVSVVQAVTGVAPRGGGTRRFAGLC